MKIGLLIFCICAKQCAGSSDIEKSVGERHTSLPGSCMNAFHLGSVHAGADARTREKFIHMVFGGAGVAFKERIVDLSRARPSVASDLATLERGLAEFSSCVMQKFATEHDLTLSPTFEQGPDQKLTLDRATYGTERKQIDVTWRLQKLVSNGVLRIPRDFSLPSIFGNIFSRFETTHLKVEASTERGQVHASTTLPWYSQTSTKDVLISSARPSWGPAFNASSFEQLLNKYVDGQAGLEIGGPSYLFRNFGIYHRAALVDIANFAEENMWHTFRDGQNIEHEGGGAGRQFVMDGSTLHKAKNDSYDFILGSHYLEHLLNPLESLFNIRRVLRPGGVVILIVPRKEACFDHLRGLGDTAELIFRFVNGIKETDMEFAHVDEFAMQNDIARDTAARDFLYLLGRNIDNVAQRGVHQFVYDLKNLPTVLEFLSFDIKFMGTVYDDPDPNVGPMNQYVVARKPLGSSIDQRVPGQRNTFTASEGRLAEL